VFWPRGRREERRQRVLDELLTLDPGNRRERLDLAVASHELRAEEVEPALHLVERLDRLREMRVPPGGHLPGREYVPQSRQTPDASFVLGPVAAVAGAIADDDQDSGAVERLPVAIPVVADADPDPVATWLGTVDLPLDAIEAVSRLKAGRRVRRNRPGARGAGTVRRRARASVASTPGPDSTVSDVVAEAAAAADENWPSIAWLRP
jgi:hypothetical protein